MKLFLISLFFTLVLSGCAATIDKENPAYRAVVLAADAQKRGNNKEAIMYFEKAIQYIEKEKALTSPNEIVWKEMVASILWEDSFHKELISYSEKELSEVLSLKWLCLVLESRNDFDKAKSCWLNYGDTERAARVIRTKVILDLF